MKPRRTPRRSPSRSRPRRRGIARRTTLDTIAAYLFTFAFFRQIERDALRRIAARATLHVVFPGDDATVITRPAGESGEASGSAGSGGASGEPLISLLVLVGCVEATSKPSREQALTRAWAKPRVAVRGSCTPPIGPRSERCARAMLSPDALAAAGKALETMLASNARSPLGCVPAAAALGCEGSLRGENLL